MDSENGKRKTGNVTWINVRAHAAVYIRELNLDPVNARGRGRRRGSTSTTEEHEMSPKKNEDSCNGFDSTFTHQDWLNFLQNKLLGCISWTMVRRPSSLFYISTSKWRPKVEHLKKKNNNELIAGLLWIEHEKQNSFPHAFFNATNKMGILKLEKYKSTALRVVAFCCFYSQAKSAVTFSWQVICLRFL